jgi:hypothetical protein
MMASPDFRVDFDVHVYGRNQTIKMTMSDFEVIRFAGLKAPPTKVFENPNKNKLYIPLDDKYPGFDLFYYQSQAKTFYCIQITIQENPMEHVIKNDDQVYQFNESEPVALRPNTSLSRAIYDWLEYLPNDTVFVELWMLNQKYLEAHRHNKRRSDRLNHMNVIYFHTMAGIEALPSYFQSNQ